MLAHLNKIDDFLLSILKDETAAGSEVHMNRLVPLNIGDEEGKYIYAYNTTDVNSAHDAYASEYDLQASYAFECLVASKNDQTILEESRALAHATQQILLRNEHSDGLYWDLFYQKSNIINEQSRTVPLVGVKMEYNLRYLAGLV